MNLTMLTTGVVTGTIMTAGAITGALALEVLCKGTLALLLACAAARLMRRSSAAARHAVWAAALLALVLLPAASLLLPGWRILPHWVNDGQSDTAASSAPTTMDAAIGQPSAAVDLGRPVRVPRMVDAGQYPTSPMSGDGTDGRDLTSMNPAWPAAQHAADVTDASAAASHPGPLHPTLALAARFLLPVWALGAFIVLLPLALSWLKLRSLSRQAVLIDEGPGRAAIEAAAARLHINRRVTLLRGTADVMPMTWGTITPTVLLPADAGQWPATQRDAVLLHELAHIKRLDCFVHLAARLICCAYWFHPLGWFALAHLRRDAELACDDLVLLAGADNADYADMLLHTATGLRPPMLASTVAQPMARHSSLEGRLLAILDRSRHRAHLTRAGAAATTILVAAVAIPVAMLRAAPPPPEVVEGALERDPSVIIPTTPTPDGPVFVPVVEVTINDMDESVDHQWLDIDTGKTYTLTERPRDLPAWLSERGIDLGVDFTSRGFAIMAVGLELAQQVDASRWDTLSPDRLTDDIRKLKHSLPGDQQKNDDAWRLHIFNAPPKLPLTTTFRTADGLQGILQIVEIDTQKRTVRLRYKVVETKPMDAEAKRADDGADAEARGHVTLTFPAGRSLGLLYEPDAKYPEDGTWFNWNQLAEAQGQVAVPEGVRLRLDIGDLTAEAAHSLLKLPAGVLLQLRVGGAVDAQALAAVIQHHRIEQLHLGGKLTDDVAEAVGQAATLIHFLPGRDEISDAQIAAIASSKSIESIMFGGEWTNDGTMVHIAAMPALKKLFVYGADVGDAGIAHFAKHPTLESITTNDLDLGDDALAALATVPHLRTLELVGAPRVTNAGMEHLKKATGLQTIRLDAAQVTGKGLAALAELPDLRRLTPPTPVDSAGIEAIARMKRLEILHVGRVTADEASLMKLAQLKSLNEINIGGDHVTDKVVATLATLPNLKRLWLQNAPVTDDGLAALGEHADLEALLIHNLPVTAEGLMKLSSMKSLSYLTITGQRDGLALPLAGIEHFKALHWFVKRDGVTDEDLLFIAQLKQLERLDIGGDITDAGLAHLRGMPQLWQLSLQQSKLTDAGMKHLTTMPKLSNLAIGGDITDAGVAELRGATTLTGVYINSLTISDHALEQLREALPLHPRVDRTPGRPPVADDKVAKVGKPAPTFKTELLDGTTFALDQQKGKAVLMYFWATWCSPCVASVDEIKAAEAELAKKYDKRFVMLSVSMSTHAHETRRFVENHTLAWPQTHVGLNSDLASLYGAKSAPTYVVIDPQGVVVSHSNSLEEAVKAVDESLANSAN